MSGVHIITSYSLKPLHLKTKNDLSRRHFIKNTASAGLAFSVIPSHVIGGTGRVAPSGGTQP